MPALYRIHYLNRRGTRVWDIPLAGTTITRRSLLIPATMGREALLFDYHDAMTLVDRLNHNLPLVGLPGKCFAVMNLPRVNVMAGCQEICA